MPLEFGGVSPAVKDLGAILVKVMHELEIECEPRDLPKHIVVDVSKLQKFDDKILVSELKLPTSAKVSVPLDEVVAMTVEAKEEVIEEAPAADLSAIEISEERGKKPEAEGADKGGKGAEGAAPAAEAPGRKPSTGETPKAKTGPSSSGNKPEKSAKGGSASGGKE